MLDKALPRRVEGADRDCVEGLDRDGAEGIDRDEFRRAAGDEGGGANGETDVLASPGRTPPPGTWIFRSATFSSAVRSLSGFSPTKSSTRDCSVELCLVARTSDRHMGQVYFAASMLLREANQDLAQAPQFV